MRWIEAKDKYMLLKTAVSKVAANIRGCAYLVGSALTSETRPRDVDVRIVLPNDVFERRYKIQVADWLWQARICEWSAERWNWYHEQERYGIMIAGVCTERTIDLGIIPESIWTAVYANAPHEELGTWTWEEK